MQTTKPISLKITEYQVFRPDIVEYLWYLEKLDRIIKKIRLTGVERNVVAEMPAGMRINGILSDEEIRKFFYFLYLEPSSNGKPFLTKEVFDMVFANGLVIPEVPLAKKYKINCSLGSPRNQIDYAIHLLMQIHKGGKKAPYLKFFGSYFEEYSDALVSPRKLEMLASNITGEKSTRCKIDFNKYLPVIFKNNTCYFIK